MKKSLKQTIADAVAVRDLAQLGALVDRLRTHGFAGVRFSYACLADLFHRCAGLDADQFEDLMLEKKLERQRQLEEQYRLPGPGTGESGGGIWRRCG